MKDILVDLQSIIKRGFIKENESMKGHTTLKIGGDAAYFVSVFDRDELLELMKYINQNSVPYFLLGNGSNILVSDNGFDGVVITLDGEFKEMSVSGTRITAGAGAFLSQISRTALEHSLTGVEFASGIPGTLGGALVMNAGAYGGEMKQIVKTVCVLEKDKTGYEIKSYTVDDMKFAYRYSIAKERELIFLSAEMALTKGEASKIKETMEELNRQRREKQPLEYPSAGSTFKRPEGYFAGKLISDAGLKGYSVGGAQVSEKHAGFCINKGNATAADFERLMQDVIKKVKEETGVVLEPEIEKV